VTYMPIARQRFGKHIPEVTLSTIGHPLLGNGTINMHSWQQRDGVFRGVRAEGTVRRIKEYEKYRGVQRSTKQLRVQLWSVNQRATEAEESPLLRFVTRKRLVKTLQRNSHCGELLPSKD
jgi:hypothetical protein